MSHTPMKKSVFERIERGGGNSSPSSTANTSHKSTHGFCNIYIKDGTCPLGDTCKYIHEQPNLDKQQGSKGELRITKTITRVVDMSSPSIKSTVTVSNEQRAVSSSTSTPSSRTVIESGLTSNEQSNRRLSSSDHKQSQRRSSDTKRKSSSNLNESSVKKKSHPSSKNKRSMDSDSPVDSTSDSEYTHSSHKSKKKSDTHSTSTKYKPRESISPQYDEDETLNDQLLRQTQTNVKSPKRTIVITDRKKDENIKRTSKYTKSNPDIEFLGSKIISRDKKSIETIHQQAENNKKSMDIKRERKSPSRSSSDQQKRRSSVTTTNNAMINDRNMQVKIEDTKHQSNKAQNSSEQSDRASQLTPPIVQLSPSPSITTTSDILEKGSVTLSNELEKTTSVQPPSPICVILDDDDSIPSPSTDKKVVPQSSTIPVKRTHESDKSSSKPAKRSHDSDKNRSKEKTNDNTETKRKRLNDDSSKKPATSRKTENDNRSTSNRSDSRRPVNTSSRDEPSSRQYKEKPESRPGKSNGSKDRNLPAPPPPPSSSKSRGASDRRDVTRSSPEKKRSTHRRGKEKGLENVTDSEEHIEEPVIPKQTALEAYMSMDWSLLSRDKRIPMNTQVTSRIARVDNSINLVGVSERLLTKEQKEKLNAGEFQSSPLTHFMKQLQTKSSSQIINSCHRRFGSCAKDMIDMRHKWFLRSAEPVQQYEFINKEHYIAFQQAINSLLDKTSNDTPTLPIETTTTTTTTTDALLS
ncbi:unnamed protein product [Rotaria socialis]|uniref:C3H1-type domain-containing protein n=1 Tax=Rotaria socialis TaxID=392032 RepID=A0A818X772_9BILA|nr:unnamed protein product [Rotaria socialis]